MPVQSAVVLSIDRLGAGWLGPYGNTWLETPHFNRLAAQSLLLETALADSSELALCFRAWWTGRHALEPTLAPTPAPSANERTSLPVVAAAAGVRSVLVTDDPAVADHPLAAGFRELQLVPQPPAEGSAGQFEETGLFRLFSAAVALLEEYQEPALVWIHARGMSGPWDAPLEFRNRFADEDDPEPPKLIEPPNKLLAPGFDPDELLGYAHAYAGQVALADECLGMLLAALDAHPQTDQTLLAVTSPRGYPLGEHQRVGPCDEALYGELLHVPLMVRFPDRLYALERTGRIVQPGETYWLLAEACSWLPSGDVPADSLLAELRGESSALPRLACSTLADSTSGKERAIRTPAWFLRESHVDGVPRRELFAKPDDRWEANEVSSRCEEEVALLAAELERFELAARNGQLAQNPLLAERLGELWR